MANFNRYHVYTFDGYYPEGGWNDFSASFATLEEAKEQSDEFPGEFQQIVDVGFEEIVAYRRKSGGPVKDQIWEEWIE